MEDPELLTRIMKDPELLTRVTKKTEAATLTVLDMLASGVPLGDALDIVEGAITANMMEDDS